MGWGDLAHVLEDIFDESGLPVGSSIRWIGDLFTDHPAAPAPAQPGPGPGNILGPAGAPPPPLPPVDPPPPGPDGPSGQAAGAAGADGQHISMSVDDLAEMDKDAQATLVAIHEAGQAGRQQLDNIQRDVDAKITELGPRLNTPQGQQELREFLKAKLTDAKGILDKAADHAEEQANKTRDLTKQYAGVGGGDNPFNTPPDKPGNPDKPGGDPPGGNPGTTPAAVPPGTTPAGAPLGPGMMMPGGGVPGFGGGGFPSIPLFGGGGVPGVGGDPLGVGNPHGETVGFDDPEDRHHGDDQKHQSEVVGADPSDKSDKKGDQTGAGTQPAGNAEGTEGGDHAQDVSAGQQQQHGTDVTLPDNSGVVHARTEQGATAVRAALGGTPVADAWKQAGIELPPAGTPVTDPVPPTQLKAGDIGMWKDHMVMALGGGKVLVSGQIQPQDSLGSGPDFLGWFDPTKHAAPAPAAPVTPPAPAPPAQPS